MSIPTSTLITLHMGIKMLHHIMCTADNVLTLYTLSDWFNKWWNIPSDQSASSSHMVTPMEHHSVCVLLISPQFSLISHNSKAIHRKEISIKSFKHHHLFNAVAILLLTTQKSHDQCLMISVSMYIHHISYCFCLSFGMSVRYRLKSRIWGSEIYNRK